MGRLTIKRIGGATLLETIVAMVIIFLVFGIATTIMVRVSATSVSMRKVRAEGVLKSYAFHIRQQRLFFDGDEVVDSFRIKRTAASAATGNRLWRMHYAIYDRDSIVLYQWDQDVLAE